MGAELGKHLEFRRLVFPRQMVRVTDLLALPEADRVTPIVAAARRSASASPRCGSRCPTPTTASRSPRSPSRSRRTSKRRWRKPASRSTTRRPRSACTCSSWAGARATWAFPPWPTAPRWPMGIARLRMPSAAPSRSTLKLAEALLEFLDEKERAKRLAPGMTAIDLGASPGGWTWQLVQRRPHGDRRRQRPHGCGAPRDRAGEAPARRRLPLPAGRARRLDGVRHGGEPLEDRAPRRELDRRGLVPRDDLQPEAADEEALGGGRALPRRSSTRRWAEAATTCA